MGMNAIGFDVQIPFFCFFLICFIFCVTAYLDVKRYEKWNKRGDCQGHPLSYWLGMLPSFVRDKLLGLFKLERDPTQPQCDKK